MRFWPYFFYVSFPLLRLQLYGSASWKDVGYGDAFDDGFVEQRGGWAMPP
jgi:hypothetical protein